jgi:hypothetical protein
MNVAALYIKGVQGICESEPALAQTIMKKAFLAASQSTLLIPSLIDEQEWY